MEDFALFIARLFLGVPFIIWGFLKLRGGEVKLIPGLRALGLPDPKAFAYLVGLCEFLGGVAVVIGFPAQLASFLLGVWCIITGVDAHRHQPTELLKNIAMAGGYFMLAIAGPGAWALFAG